VIVSGIVQQHGVDGLVVATRTVCDDRLHQPVGVTGQPVSVVLRLHVACDDGDPQLRS
jgi:hypothetical protein